MFLQITEENNKISDVDSLYNMVFIFQHLHMQ